MKSSNTTETYGKNLLGTAPRQHMSDKAFNLITPRNEFQSLSAIIKEFGKHNDFFHNFEPLQFIYLLRWALKPYTDIPDWQMVGKDVYMTTFELDEFPYRVIITIDDMGITKCETDGGYNIGRNRHTIYNSKRSLLFAELDSILYDIICEVKDLGI